MIRHAQIVRWSGFGAATQPPSRAWPNSPPRCRMHLFYWAFALARTS